MKKVALALLVLALSVSVPAMAAVNITMSKGTVANYNKVTIGYNCDGGEEVRAFALTITVTDGGFLVDSALPVGDPNVADYWVYPGSITFTIDEGNTVVDGFGTPVAEQDANGGVVEMASLYAASDPCHPDAPAASGSLCSFRVRTANCGPDNLTSVSLALNSKRGGVVLKDPNVIPTVNLPAAVTFNMCCWICPAQEFGDASGDGKVTVLDLAALRKAWQTTSAGYPHGTGIGQYNCCADFNHDLKVTVLDLAKLRINWQSSGLGTCTNKYCP
jgi:hypothetical protein